MPGYRRNYYILFEIIIQSSLTKNSIHERCFMITFMNITTDMEEPHEIPEKARVGLD